MSKKRGKVIGGVATTPINVDAFIKKSLEEGGLINETIKNNSGIKAVTIPDGEVSETSILEMEEGIFLLKGKFHYYPIYYSDNTSYNPVINFEREVIACVTKSEGEDAFLGGDTLWWERKHLWYFDATANKNTGSQVIITVKYNGEMDVYDYSVNHTPNKYLERSSNKQTEIDDLFYSRLADEEGRTEFYPSIGTMADYVTNQTSPIVNKSTGELISLSDSAEAPLNNIKIFGKTTQNGTPTPESPIDLVSVGDNGNLSIISGKNILPYPYVSSKTCPAGYTDNGDGSITADWRHTGNLRYFHLYDGDLLSTGTTQICLLGEYNHLWVYCKILDGNNKELYSESSPKSLVLDVSKYPTAKKMKIGIRNSGDANSNVSGTVYPVYMSDFSEWIIPMPIPLRSIVGTDIRDEIDTKRKVRIQRVGREIVTGATSTFASGNCTGCRCRITNFPKWGKACSDRYSQYDASSGVVNNTIRYGGDPDIIHLYDNRIPYGATNIANTILVKEKPEVLYELAEPIETPLTDEEIQIYKALYTCYPNTTIYNSDGADMEVEYVADTKNYIDNKFAELQANILSVVK